MSCSNIFYIKELEFGVQRIVLIKLCYLLNWILFYYKIVISRNLSNLRPVLPNFFLLSSHQREIFCTIFTSPQKVKGIIGKSLVWPISRFMLSWGKHDFPFIRTKSSSSQKFTQIEYSFYQNKAIIWQQSRINILIFFTQLFNS